LVSLQLILPQLHVDLFATLPSVTGHVIILEHWFIILLQKSVEVDIQFELPQEHKNVFCELPSIILQGDKLIE